ncbi:secretion system protein [Bordetella pertussis]|uniref:Bacterial secretion system protein n=1 Tax=Bordetella pertussis (strain ATCC 9797 / DSM 5571 / CCUG 30873 / LMG 14455 / NCTC 10739 / 18323) TaxID=568706 RepID=A0A0T7CTX8_BORP1|nr:type IV secretion system protein PtlC [Bordetella pertussis]AZR86478.1 type IV secretion protein C [Bordetella pertussis]PNO99251.1 type IV secretion system protein PtlC [Bordetella pertussis 18323]UEB57111.1 type IV secretion system protein PtlC [Bordetella pertussis]CCJ65011.1 putative bacterial secretion system protein [Bordetella pertussis 18323]CFP40954.1 secretion system protein [Bordetella pertussis]
MNRRGGQTAFAAIARNERAIAAFIPYSSHLTDTTLITHGADLVRTWRVQGIAFESAEPELVSQRHEQLNGLWRAISCEQVALWIHCIRRKTQAGLDARYENPFCRALDASYNARLNARQAMTNEFYLTLVYRPGHAALGKRAHHGQAEVRRQLLAHVRRMDEIGSLIETTLRSHGENHEQAITVLGCETDSAGRRYSRTLTLLEFLLTGHWQPVRVPAGPVDAYLGSSRILAGAEMMELRSPTCRRYAQFIDFKEYGTHTEPGMLNALLYEDYEYVITHSFSAVGKRQALAYLQRQRAQLANVQDAAYSQIDDLAHAEDALVNGDFVIGEYHFSMMILGADPRQLRRDVSSAMTRIQERGFLATPVTLALDAAFYAQLPANWAYRSRKAMLTSRNFAGLCSFHNFYGGKRDGNPWGPALSLLSTPSGQPFYFNFHHSGLDEDCRGQMMLGNTRIIGQSGSGKTVLLNFLLCQLQKFRSADADGLTTIFFDKDRGAEICIRALDGQYLRIRDGEPTGFNPLQLPCTDRNVMFLDSLLAMLARAHDSPLTSAQHATLATAVRTVLRMPASLRRMSTLLQNITQATSEQRELVRRLGRWCRDDGAGGTGMLWWVFDNPNDCLDFSRPGNYGIDGTAFLDNAETRTPISMYLLHRMNEAMDGRRFVYLMDEAWKWIDDPAFAEFAGDQQLTIRKKNGLGVFSTQMPSSLLGARVAASLVQQCATEIYLPNPRADRAEYLDGFKCTETEYQLIRSMAEDSHLFLVKQGRQAVVAQLDLSGMDDELAILSGNARNLRCFEQALALTRERDPNDWIAVFHRLRREASAGLR